MAIMMGDLYAALVDGGTSEEKAQKAAQEVADFNKQLSEIRTDLSLLKGLMGVAVAGILALVIRAFFG